MKQIVILAVISESPMSASDRMVPKVEILYECEVKFTILCL